MRYVVVIILLGHTAMQTWKTQLRKGIVELCVLGVLKRDGEAYGYQLLQALGTIAGLTFSESTVYPVLARLAQNGLVAARTEASPSGPPRRYFRLTAHGEKRLLVMQSEWQLVSDSLNRLFQEGGEK